MIFFNFSKKYAKNGKSLDFLILILYNIYVILIQL